MGWAIPAPPFYAPGTSPFVLYTTDAGKHWAQQTIPEGFGGAVDVLAFADDQRGVAVGAAPNSGQSRPAAAIATDDGGLSWRAASFTAGVGQLLDVTIVP
jgi:photosystem II stability/assembly factor-like uncharacterized protein